MVFTGFNNPCHARRHAPNHARPHTRTPAHTYAGVSVDPLSFDVIHTIHCISWIIGGNLSMLALYRNGCIIVKV